MNHQIHHNICPVVSAAKQIHHNICTVVNAAKQVVKVAAMIEQR